MSITNSYIPVNWSNMTNFNDFLVNANQSAGNALFAGIDLMIFFILLITLTSTFTWEIALFAAGFVTLILSVIFVYAGVLSITFAGYFVGAIIVLVMYVMWSSSRNG